jgi:hypothetical protein
VFLQLNHTFLFGKNTKTIDNIVVLIDRPVRTDKNWMDSQIHQELFHLSTISIHLLENWVQTDANGKLI